MQCRNCGTEIADKALICYKCGAATTDAKYAPVPLKAKGGGPNIVWIVILIAILALAALYYLKVIG